MKKIFASAMIFAVGFASAQTVAYKGAGDVKVNLGANLQDGGTGIVSSVDYGLGESFSIGAQAGYLLGVKERILEGVQTVSQVAYELGFQYPQHFSRLFKKHVGCTPNEYKQKN
jgi:hypothetical protein